ncbi:MAG: low molecular weight protein arginine phosphatase, partial [Elusimicrobiota bacterium]
AGRDIETSSAGTYANADFPTPEPMVTVMQEEGIEGYTHRPRRLDTAMVEAATVILAMAHEHKENIVRNHPQAKDKTFLLMEFAAQGPKDIADPIGSGLETYRRCKDEIKTALAAVIRRLDNHD